MVYKGHKGKSYHFTGVIELLFFFGGGGQTMKMRGNFEGFACIKVSWSLGWCHISWPLFYHFSRCGIAIFPCLTFDSHETPQILTNPFCYHKGSQKLACWKNIAHFQTLGEDVSSLFAPVLVFCRARSSLRQNPSGKPPPKPGSLTVGSQAIIYSSLLVFAGTQTSAQHIHSRKIPVFFFFARPNRDSSFPTN